MGRMKLEQYGDRQQNNPILPDPYTWENITPDLIDPLKQVHLLIFSNSAMSSTSPFGAVAARPRLGVRKTFTYSTSLT